MLKSFKGLVNIFEVANKIFYLKFNFRSDVERLIREGAVRTVKKPTQIKKQLVTTQPSMFMPKEECTGDVITKAESQIESINRRNAENKKTKITPNYVKPVNESTYFINNILIIVEVIAKLYFQL